MSDEYATFRAAQPSVSAALAACTRPDWLVELAFEALDHKVAVRIGSTAARMLTRTSDTLWLFDPSPNRLEAVDAWAADDADANPVADDLRNHTVRAITLASFPAAVVAYVGQRFVIHGAWTAARAVVYVAAIIAFEVVFALLVRGALAGVVRRRAARLDDHAALAIVLDELRKGAAAHPQVVPIVMKSIGGRIRQLVDGEPK